LRGDTGVTLITSLAQLRAAVLRVLDITLTTRMGTRSSHLTHRAAAAYLSIAPRTVAVDVSQHRARTLCAFAAHRCCLATTT